MLLAESNRHLSRRGCSMDFMDNTKTWGRWAFEKVCIIYPEKDGSGNVLEFRPQVHYQNRNGLPLNLYGRGSFCKFRIRNDKRFAGVYVLAIVGEVTYVGECINISSRYNNGYGNISPRNCYAGGQLTNCRINNLIYSNTVAGQQI